MFPLSLFAVGHEDGLHAPTLGQWVPRVEYGAHLHEGLLLGHILRLGRPVEVVAPAGARGQVVTVRVRSAVEYGDNLVEVGQVEGAELVEAAVDAVDDGLTPVNAPMAGTIYHRPAPGEPAFAEPGQPVKARQTLALIEVMKTFTQIQAPRAGVLARWGVGDGEAIDGDTPVAWLK